jgi:hypothetical protein
MEEILRVYFEHNQKECELEFVFDDLSVKELAALKNLCTYSTYKDETFNGYYVFELSDECLSIRLSNSTRHCLPSQVIKYLNGNYINEEERLYHLRWRVNSLVTHLTRLKTKQALFKKVLEQHTNEKGDTLILKVYPLMLMAIIAEIKSLINYLNKQNGY